jgi:uncharacterized protein with GYD domain
MAMFIMLARSSAEGVRTLKNNPHRIQEVNREVEQFGARVVQQYALLGPYDFITVLDAPDPETVSRVWVELASRGAASYETLTAILVDEFVSRLGEGGGRGPPTARNDRLPGRPSRESGRKEPQAPGKRRHSSRPRRVGNRPALHQGWKRPPPRTSGIEEGTLPRREETAGSRVEGVPIWTLSEPLLG